MSDEEIAETISGSEGDDGVAVQQDDAVQPDPVEPVETPPDEKKPEPIKPAATPAVAPEPVVTDAAKRLAAIEAQVNADDFDPYSKEGKALILEHGRVAARVESEPTQRKVHSATIYDEIAEEHEITTTEAKTLWKETIKALPDRFKGDQGAADYAYQQRISAFKSSKGKPVVKKAASTPAISPGQVLPRAGSVPTQPKPVDERTIEEKVLAGDKETLAKFKAIWE